MIIRTKNSIFKNIYKKIVYYELNNACYQMAEKILTVMLLNFYYYAINLNLMKISL